MVPVIGGGVRYGGNLFGAQAQLGKDIAGVWGGKKGIVGSLETAGKVFGVPGTVQARKTFRDLQKFLDDSRDFTIKKKNFKKKKKFK